MSVPTFLSDEPTLTDLLGRMTLAKQIGDTVAACVPPCVLGIHGDWGSGKTSFLHTLQHYLTGECPQAAGQPLQAESVDEWKVWKRQNHIAVIWFEAWRYQQELVPVVPLLHEIRAQLSTPRKLLASAKKLGEVAIKSALFGMEGLTKQIGLQASKVQEVGEKWEKEHYAEPIPAHTLRQLLTDTLRTLLPKGDKARIVVLVDDLDRCEPQAAYKLLEGIKIYLNLPNCVFVLGVNQRVIEAGLAEQIAKEKVNEPAEEARQRAREYMEKICKNYWHLPALLNTQSLVDQWLDLAMRSTPAYTAYSRISVGSLVQRHHCLPPNPRRIKAFVNTLARFLAHAAANGDLATPVHETCVMLAYLHQFNPEIYRIIEAEPDFFEEIVKWCVAPPPAGDENVHELLRHLLPAQKGQAESTTPTPETGAPSYLSTFPDPSRGNVFRIQSLVRYLNTEVPAGLTTELFQRCLIRGTT